MSVLSPRTSRVDLVRSVAVVLAALVQLGVAVPAGAAVGALTRAYPTPLRAAGWASGIWLLIYLGFLGYAVLQARPAQRERHVHRVTGWWLVWSAVFNVGLVLSAAAGWPGLAEIMLVGLLVVVTVAFGRLTREPARSGPERVLFRGPVALYAGWVCLLFPMVTASTGAWVGLPGSGPLAVIAAVVVLLAVTAIVSWAVLSGTAVVAFAAAAGWAIVGISLSDPPAGVVVAGAIAIVLVLAAVARRLATTGYPTRAAWG